MESVLNSAFRIHYEWLPCEYGTVEERMTLADLELSVGDHCATELHDDVAKTVRRSARLSAFHLAEWFAVNWWRMIWEPSTNDVSWRMSHQVGGAGGGYLWPDLSFSSDWDTITVSSRQTESSPAEPLRYLKDFRVKIPIAEFQQGVDEFLHGTIARLADTMKSETELSTLWRGVMRERRDQDGSRWRQLEACMGYDPDEGPSDLLHSLLRAIDTYGEGAVREIASACRKDSASQIDSLAEEANAGDVRVLISSYDELRSKIALETDPSHRPWMRANQAARIARQSWCLDGPVNASKFADLFAISKSEICDYTSVRGRSVAAGFRDPDDPATMRIGWNIRSPASRRFWLARLVADNLVSPSEEKLLPATGVRTGRQQFQRAFAQEFLCPYEALRETIGGSSFIDDDDIEHAARHFEVSTWVIVYALVNNGALPQESLADWGLGLAVPEA